MRFFSLVLAAVIAMGGGVAACKGSSSTQPPSAASSATPVHSSNSRNSPSATIPVSGTVQNRKGTNLFANRSGMLVQGGYMPDGRLFEVYCRTTGLGKYRGLQLYRGIPANTSTFYYVPAAAVSFRSDKPPLITQCSAALAGGH